MKVWKQAKRHYKFATLSYWIKKEGQDWEQRIKRVALRKQVTIHEPGYDYLHMVCLEVRGEN